MAQSPELYFEIFDRGDLIRIEPCKSVKHDAQADRVEIPLNLISCRHELLKPIEMAEGGQVSLILLSRCPNLIIQF
jgi:hypothetical protein